MTATAWTTDSGAVVLRCPYPPSKKNGTVIRRGRGGKSFVGKGDAVKASEAELQIALQTAIGDLAVDGSLMGDQDVHVEIEQLVESAELLVTVRPAGAPAKVNGRTGRKRDLQNLQDTVLDAMQGIVFDDDRQVTRLEMRRVIEGER